MNLSCSALDCLAGALHHAAQLGLEPRRKRVRDYTASAHWSFQEVKAAVAAGTLPTTEMVLRPMSSEVRVRAMFLQQWGSTALGFGGMGGAAITPAYTVVVEGPQRDLAVYWAGQFAYRIPSGTDAQKQAAFWQDIQQGRCAPRSEAFERYGALESPAGED